MSNPERLTSKQVAEALGVSQSTVRNWSTSGLLKAVRLPSGHRRFYKDDIDRMRREMFGGSYARLATKEVGHDAGR
jgi:excisionase family DNA binding protein